MIEINGGKFKTYNFDEINCNKYYGFIYVTVNKVNGKKYVGKHTRWVKNYIGSGKHLWNAVKKHGIENFERFIIDVSLSEEELSEKELHYINEKFNAVKSKNWYNISSASDGGNTLAGYTEDEMKQFKKNVSNGFKNMDPEKRRIWLENVRNNHVAVSGKRNGMYGSARFGEKNPMFGKKHSEESKRRNSESQKGKRIGENAPMFGKTTDSIRRAHSKPMIAFKDGEVYGEFPSILAFSKAMGSERKGDKIDQQVRKLVAGHIFKLKYAKFYGWSIEIKKGENRYE